MSMWSYCGDCGDAGSSTSLNRTRADARRGGSGAACALSLRSLKRTRVEGPRALRAKSGPPHVESNSSPMCSVTEFRPMRARRRRSAASRSRRSAFSAASSTSNVDDPLQEVGAHADVASVVAEGVLEFGLDRVEQIKIEQHEHAGDEEYRHEDPGPPGLRVDQELALDGVIF